MWKRKKLSEKTISIFKQIAGNKVSSETMQTCLDLSLLNANYAHLYKVYTACSNLLHFLSILANHHY